MGRGRAPCCEKVGLKKGSWTPAEDMRLMAYIQKYGHGNWRALPKQAGLLRCGKSCRLRWINYLRPDIKRGNFTKEEEDAIIKLHELLGNKWSKIASRLPGRTDNEIKNVWNTHLKKRLVSKQEQTTNSAEKLKESPSSSSSDSSISYCNQSDDSREVAHGASGPGTNKDTSEVCNSPEKERKEDSDEIIEIPIEPNLDIWDMLEEGSSQSPISTNNNDMNIWDEHFNKHLLEGLEGLEGPEVLIDERRDTSSSSSYDSNATCYNLGEMASQLVSYEANDISPKNNQIHSDQMPENELWKMLDDDSCLFGSDHVVDPMGDELGIPKNPITSEEESTMESENNKWISYLEKELDLWGANEQSPMEDAVEPSLSSLQEQGEILLDVGMDPVTCYFQKRPSSPSPFCL